jgi:hypothetical protein
MIADNEVWTAARYLSRVLGDAATYEVAVRADKMLDRGDLDNAAHWRRVLKAIQVLQSTEVPEGATRH